MKILHRYIGILLSICIGITSATVRAAEADHFRPPAVPLVTSDPYLSVWSESDHLTDTTTHHWTGKDHALVSLIRIDGHAYRLMGNDPSNLPPLTQTSLKVSPTRTIYTFASNQIRVTLTFMTPALPSDLNVMARPVTYITWDVASTDGANHQVQLYYSTSSQLAVNKQTQQVTCARETAGDLTALKTGTITQELFSTPADDVRIDWGYAYTAASSNQASAAFGANKTMLASFTDQGKLPTSDDTRLPRAVNDDQPVLAFDFDLGQVSSTNISRHVLVAYDETYAIKFFDRNLRPYWAKDDPSAAHMLQAAENDYTNLIPRCEKFDDELLADAKSLGGQNYADICALAYRESWAGNGIAADKNGQPLLFTKENTSNGDIATVDVIFPMDPIWVLLSPTLAKSSLVPVLAYAKSSHWKFPNAPHDLGTYPIARGTDDGGEGMPVEESGNMLILIDAIAQQDGNANFATPWWPKLSQWAQYLEQYGLDPEDQLCTDDFMGHLAHNSNLSIKAIIALAAYGDLCKMRGDTANAEKYTTLAKTDAQHWIKASSEGDHSNLAFDRPNTWSQKYNLVWDRVLGLNVFPPEVAAHEIEYYKKQMQPFGIPLDSRTKLTKSDWSIWSASLAENQADFETLIAPIVKYLNQTSARVPFADSYETNKISSSGMHARPVIGGVFIRFLTNRDIWKKWASADIAKVGGWAEIPPPPKITEVVPTARTERLRWHYTTDHPAENWMNADFNDNPWKTGTAGFGTAGTPGATIHTRWNSADIWLRRQITVPQTDSDHLQFLIDHDEDVEIYVDGILAAHQTGFTTGYITAPIDAPAKALLKPGAKIVLAVHCHQTTGGQAIDVGLAHVVEGE